MGYIFRQEAVSMIPILLLSPQPGEQILDMCAAPGSKTTQIIENSTPRIENPTTTDILKMKSILGNKGVIVANDIDSKRAGMLTYLTKRTNSPNVLILNHNAQLLPKLRHSEHSFYKFDKILCDVPCSGDGTLRKNPDMWKTYHPHFGHGNHRRQLPILRKALTLLKIGTQYIYI